MASFAIPCVTPNADSWGPPALDNANPNAAPILKFAALPYAPFGRSDRLGRAADFTSNHHARSGPFQQSGRFQRYNNNNRQQEEEPAEDTFQLVDTTKTATSKRFVNPANKRRQFSQRLRQINARRQQSTGVAATTGLDKMVRGSGVGGRGGGRFPARGGGRFGGRGAPGGRGFGGRGFTRIDRQPSVSVQSSWTQVDDIDLSKVSKKLIASTDVPEAEDLLWCGFLDAYSDIYDKVAARQPVPLKRMEDKEFYPVTTTDDPVLERFAIDGRGQVFITDTSTLSLAFTNEPLLGDLMILTSYLFLLFRFIHSPCASHDLHPIRLSVGYCHSKTSKWYYFL
jgi:translation initiation factor 3 subunit D